MDIKQFRLRRRVKLGGISATELRAALSRLNDSAIIKIYGYRWVGPRGGGQALIHDGGRVPFELQSTTDGSELIIRVMSGRGADGEFRRSVRAGKWGRDPDSHAAMLERKLAPLDTDEAKADSLEDIVARLNTDEAKADADSLGAVVERKLARLDTDEAEADSFEAIVARELARLDTDEAEAARQLAERDIALDRQREQRRQRREELRREEQRRDPVKQGIR